MVVKNENYIFTVGMFRSGTTLLGRSLNAHPNIKIATDPYIEFFRAFRNEVYKENGDKLADDNAPLDDNFFNEHIKSTIEICNATFDREIKNQKLEDIKKKIIEQCSTYSPLIVPFVKDVDATNYKELFKKLMLLVQKAYGDEQSQYIGIKEVWAEEFIAPLINTFPNIKCIHISRDPRAIIASRKASKLKMYPLLFFIRHWRKSIAYFLMNYQKKKNYYFVKYEDFITNPEFHSKKICKFLNVRYDKAMIEADKFVNGKKEKWIRSSVYGISDKITTKFMDKWKSVLSNEEIQYIEDLCDMEMKLLSYERLTLPKILHSCSHPPYEDKNNIADWLLPYASEFLGSDDNSTKELLRYYLIEDRKKAKSLDKDFTKKIFIDEDFLEKVDHLLKRGD